MRKGQVDDVSTCRLPNFALGGFRGESLVHRNGPLDSRRFDQELVNPRIVTKFNASPEPVCDAMTFKGRPLMPLRSVSRNSPSPELWLAVFQLMRKDPDSLTNPSVVLPVPVHDPNCRTAVGLAAGVGGSGAAAQAGKTIARTRGARLRIRTCTSTGTLPIRGCPAV